MIDIVTQGYTNSEGRVARVTKFCTVAPNVCGPSVWKFHYINSLTPQNFDVSRFFKTLYTPTVFFYYFFYHGAAVPPVGQGLLTVEDS
jgi:hypothetical protein